MEREKKSIITRFQDFLETKKGQTILNYLYSWGAAVVILGALFKLTHIKGADLMLFIGMGTEVIVFFISGFDRQASTLGGGAEAEGSSAGGPIVIGGGAPVVAGAVAPAAGLGVAAPADIPGKHSTCSAMRDRCSQHYQSASARAFLVSLHYSFSRIFSICAAKLLLPSQTGPKWGYKAAFRDEISNIGIKCGIFGAK